MFKESRHCMTNAQGVILAHWQSLSKRSVTGCARRQDLDIGQFRASLANISLIELGHGGAARFRLAGSAVRDMLGTEPRGQRVDTFPTNLAEIWWLGLEEAVADGSPRLGLRGGFTAACDHAWMRLPLEDASGRLGLVLCLDEFVASSFPVKDKQNHVLIPAHLPRIAA